MVHTSERIVLHRSKALISADPCFAARQVIGRLLDLSHSWRACVADLLADQRGFHLTAVGSRDSESAGETSALGDLPFVGLTTVQSNISAS
jgi:hypothetical protein